jgi:hypothetical protein
MTNMDLDTIRIHVKNGNLGYLHRRRDVEAIYNVYRNNILKEWISMEDLIKVRFLGASVKINSEGLKFASLDIQQNQIKYSLQINDYPYNLENGTKHFVLWSTNLLNEETIDKILLEELHDYIDCFWFEQDPNQKSVPGVWHIHVLVKY